MKHKIKKAFADVFGESEDLRVFFAPGRVNLIGELTGPAMRRRQGEKLTFTRRISEPEREN
ncbi:Galactokinase [Bacillus velezensis]|nr:Galactokinase [Bacillus velezensis]QOC79564.1 galactokinase [Bacillus velezensis]QYM56501.1 galactokinase [Bacillus velezensis]TWO92850.1 galactokinase [Bacillus velezensis]